jgi:hypothetical protein
MHAIYAATVMFRHFNVSSASSCSCVDDAKARLEAAATQGGFADDDLRIREKRELDLSARAIAESFKSRNP